MKVQIPRGPTSQSDKTQSLPNQGGHQMTRQRTASTAAAEGLPPLVSHLAKLAQVAQFRGPPQVMPKVRVGGAQTRAEIEADRIADAITEQSSELGKTQEPRLSSTSNVLQRSGGSDGGFPISPDFAADLRGSSAEGVPLEQRLQQELGQKLNTDLSGVRVHTGARAAQLNQQINANAFTYENDIYFDQGKYRPETTEGRRLLTHELVHTIQQQDGSQGLIQRDEKDAVNEARRILMEHQVSPKSLRNLTWDRIKRTFKNVLQEWGWWTHLTRVLSETAVRQPVADDATWEDLEEQALETKDQFSYIVSELIRDTKAMRPDKTFTKSKLVYQKDDDGNVQYKSNGKPKVHYVYDEDDKAYPLYEEKKVPYSGIGPVKTQERSEEKAKTDYQGDLGRVIDVLRATLTYKKFEDLFGALKIIWEDQSSLNFTIARVKQTYIPIDKMLYGDIKLNIAVGKIGHVCEVQLTCKDMLDAKNTDLHALYDRFRSLPPLGKSYAEHDILSYALSKRLLTKAHTKMANIAKSIHTSESFGKTVALAEALRDLASGALQPGAFMDEAGELDAEGLAEWYQKVQKQQKLRRHRSHYESIPAKIAELLAQDENEED